MTDERQQQLQTLLMGLLPANHTTVGNGALLEQFLAATHALFGFVHACGGRLRPAPTEPNPDAEFDHDSGGVRFSYRPETIYVDEDGRLVD